MEPSVEALSATMTSASRPETEASRAGRNLFRNFSPFQFNMTTAVFMRCKGIENILFRSYPDENHSEYDQKQVHGLGLKVLFMENQYAAGK